jgi:hypothetical protein
LLDLFTGDAVALAAPFRLSELSWLAATPTLFRGPSSGLVERQLAVAAVRAASAAFDLLVCMSKCAEGQDG